MTEPADAALPRPNSRVEVHEHDPRWAIDFEAEKEALRDALEGCASAIEHIGSTAVPGLPAKPTIDILLVVEQLDDVLSRLDALARVGYDYRPASLTSGEDQLFLRKVNPEGDRTHHLHVLRLGSAPISEYLSFRDYLRTHPDEASDYARRKVDLGSKYRNDRMRYVEEKALYVDALMHRVRAWSNR